jgi:hypothetical protein
MRYEEFRSAVEVLQGNTDKFLAQQNVNEIVALSALTYLVRDIFRYFYYYNIINKEKLVELIDSTKDQIDIFNYRKH